MPTFISNQAAFNGLQVTGSTAMSASTGIAARIVGTGASILAVSGTSGEILRVSDTVSSALFSVASASSNIFSVASNKAVGVNISAPTYSLEVSGTVAFKTLQTSSVALSNVLMISGSGQVFLTASSALTGITGPIAVTGSTLYSISPLSTNSPNVTQSIFFGPTAADGATDAYQSVFLGSGSGYGAYNSYQSNFFGLAAGYVAYNSQQSNFFGSGSGYYAYNAPNSNFFGAQAGFMANGAASSNFIGYQAGFKAASNANNSNFIGAGAGSFAFKAYASNFLGSNAGWSASLANNSNFIGESAGYRAVSASYSILIGLNAGKNLDVNGDPAASLKSNNIIIGTNITLPDRSKDSINIGAIIFGTGSFGNTQVTPSSAPSMGKIGINVVSPSYNFQVSGTVGFTNLITSSTALTNVVMISSSGQLFTTASSALGGGGVGSVGPGTQNYLAYFSGSTTAISSSTVYYDTGSGNVGIGTSSPGAKLHISGAAWNATSPSIILTGSINTSGSYVGINATASNSWTIAAAGYPNAGKFLFANSNLGDTLIAKVGSGDYGYSDLFLNGQTFGFALYANPNINAGYVVNNNINVGNTTYSSGSSGLLAAGYAPLVLGASGVEKMRIHLNSGDISIGSESDNKTNPGYKLNVTGSGASGSLNINSKLYVTGSSVGINTPTPSASLHVKPPSIANANNDLYLYGTIVDRTIVSALGTNGTVDAFTVGLNTTSSGAGNDKYFFRVNLNGGTSTGNYGASGGNNSLIQLNSPSKSTLILSAQAAGIKITGGVGDYDDVITTLTAGKSLLLRSDVDGTVGNGGGMYFYASTNDANNTGFRWHHNGGEQMRLTNIGNLHIGYTGSINYMESGYRLAVSGSSTSGSVNLSNAFYVKDVANSSYAVQVSGSGNNFAVNTLQNNVTTTNPFVVTGTGGDIFSIDKTDSSNTNIGIKPNNTAFLIDSLQISASYNTRLFVPAYGSMSLNGYSGVEVTQHGNPQDPPNQVAFRVNNSAFSYNYFEVRPWTSGSQTASPSNYGGMVYIDHILTIPTSSTPPTGYNTAYSIMTGSIITSGSGANFGVYVYTGDASNNGWRKLMFA